MNSKFKLLAYRVSRITAVALITATATCGEQRTPTSSLDPGIAGSTAALVSSTIAHTLLTSGNNPTNQKLYTTASISPAPNALITVAVMGHRSSGANPSPTVTGGGMPAWDEMASITLDPVGTPLKRVTIFRAMSASPGSGPITIRFNGTVSNAQWIVSQWEGVETSGANGADAIGQIGSDAGDGVNGLAVTLGAFGSSSNVALGVFGVRSSGLAVTPGTGFTEISELPSGETPADLQAEWAVNQPTIAASWSSLNGAALGVEIKAGGAPGGGEGVSAALSSVSVLPATIAASNGASTSDITVIALDANGDPVTGATVVLSATGTDNDITQPPSTTDANGVATGTISSTKAEQKTISATAGGVPITEKPTVTVDPGPPGVDTSTLTANPSTIMVGSGTSTITVTVTDDFGNPVSGATVQLMATGSGNALTQPSGTTDASGVATGSLSSTVLGTKTVSAKANGVDLTATAMVLVTDQPPAEITHTLLTTGGNTVNQKVYTTAAISPAPDALITVAVLMRRSSGALTPTVEGGGMTVWETVTSVEFDTQGSPTKRLTIFRAMSTTPGSGPLTITYPSSVSNTQWIVSQWEGVETSGVNGAGAIGQTGAARSDAATSLAVALSPFSNAASVAYGVVGVADDGPNVTPGTGFMEITAQSSGERSTVEAEYAINEPAVAASWTPNVDAGLLAVEIKAGVTAGGGISPSLSSVTIDPATITASDGTSTSQITVTAMDASSNPVENAVVELTVSGSGNSYPASGTTDVQGEWTATLSSTVAELKTVSATANNVAITDEPTVTVQPAAAATLAFLVEPVNTEWNTSITPPVQVEIGDQYGNRVTTATNDVTVAIGTNPATGTLSGTMMVAAVNGVAIFPDLSIDNLGTGYTLTARADGFTDATSGPFNITQGTPSASASTVTAETPITASDGTNTATITVTAKDANGNTLEGAMVELSVTGSANTLTPANPIPTDPSGVATATLSSTMAEDKTVSATIDGVAIDAQPTVTVTAGLPAAGTSMVSADPTSILAGGGSSTITVTVKDAYGNPVSGANVLLDAGSGNTLTQPATVTDANGQTSGTLSSTIAGQKIVSATADNVPITQTATVLVTDQPPASIVHTLLAAGSHPTNQKLYTTASISPAPNALITVAVMGHRSSGASPSPTLSGGGMTAWTEVATVTFDGVASPLKRVTLFRAMSPSPGSGPLTITFPATVSNSQWIVSQWGGVDASGVNGAGAIRQIGSDAGDGVNGLAVMLGAFGSPSNAAYGIFGVRSSALAVTPGTGFTELTEQPSGETPADLQAEWGVNQPTIAASWSGLSGAALGLEIRAGNAEPVEPVATVEVSPQSPTVVVGTTLQLTASTLDVGGEPLTGRAITWASDAPQFATVSPSGLVTGVAVGSATISATSEGKTGTSDVTVTSTAEPVASVEVTPGSANLVVGGTLQLTATPKDAAGQPLSGRTITWGTDASLIATVSPAGLVTGTGEGTATITATSEGQSGSSIISVTTGGQSALVGEWSAVLPAPIVQVHLHLLYDGRVLSFGGSSATPQLWDPTTGIFTAAPVRSLVFCSGHTFLPDGRLLVTGGGTGNGRGHPNTDIFDPATASWIVGPDMAYARWYPTNTTMPNGEVLTLAGADENGSPVPIPEVWDGTSWRQLTGASLTLPNYPRAFVAPDGRIFVAGPSAQSRWLDVSGAGSWTDGPRMNFGSRSYGSAVMYDAGKIMFVGGNSSPTNTAEIIDLNQSTPQWTYTGSLTYARWNLNATALPDGQVLVTGGVSGSRSNPSLAVNGTELWNPATGTWTLMASSAPLLRGYHSTALLLPDGRVIHSGGGDGGGTIDNNNFEIYSPPYLFRGARPIVTGATPSAVGYGQPLFVETPDGASIAKVTLIRFGSVTHAFDQAQLLVPLSFSLVAGGLSVTLPASRTVAPPGPYMLFLVNGNGVPSVGRIMLLQ